MIKVEHSVLIDRPIGEVFDYIADPAKESAWQEGVVEAGYSPGSQPGVGAELYEKRKFMGRDMVSKLVVTEYKQDKHLVAKVTEGPVPFEITYLFLIKEGGTEIKIVIQGEPGGFFRFSKSQNY